MVEIFKIKKIKISRNEKKDIKNLKSDIFKYIDKCNQGEITKEEFKKLVVLLVKYCKKTQYPDAVLEIPRVVFRKLDSSFAQYINELNTIEMDEDYLNTIRLGIRNLSELFDTTGHEMEHYHQHDSVIQYDKLSADEQGKINERIKQSIEAFKKYFRLSKDDVRWLHMILVPYLKLDVLPIF